MLAGPPPTAANPALMTALYTVLDVMAAAPGVVQSACGVLERQLSFLSPEEVSSIIYIFKICVFFLISRCTTTTLQVEPHLSSAPCVRPVLAKYAAHGIRFFLR